MHQDIKNINAIRQQKEGADMGNKTLEQNLKFCSFGYDFDGNIRLGETTFCKIIGNVNSTDKEIINNILLEECNTCKYLNDKVDNFYKEIIKLGQQKLRED